MRKVKYYTRGKYQGCENLTSYKEQGLSLKSWIESGNDIKVDGKLINDPAYIAKLYN